MGSILRNQSSPPVPGLSAAEQLAQLFEDFDALSPDERFAALARGVLRFLETIDESLARMAEMVAVIEDGRR